MRKEPQKSLQPVLKRESEFRAPSDLRLCFKISKKNIIYFHVYSLILNSVMPWRILTSLRVKVIQGNPLGLWVYSVYNPSLEHNSSCPKAKINHTLLSVSTVKVAQRNSSSKHICTGDIHILVRRNQGCNKAAPFLPRGILMFVHCSSIWEWKVVSKLT